MATKSNDYTIPILWSLGFWVLTTYFVLFTPSRFLLGTALAAFIANDRAKAKP